MDETTKILIGTISGFVIAFLAEPVKLYFQNSLKRKDLRRAIYYEIYANWIVANAMIDSLKEEEQIEVIKRGISYGLRTECFQRYTSHDIVMFYQLKEAGDINLLYAYLRPLIDWNQLSDEESVEYDPKVLLTLFASEVKQMLQSNKLNEKFMNKAVGKRIKL